MIAHLVGGLAAYVIAFEQDLAASAGAHHAMAKVFEAGAVVSRAHENYDRDCERGDLQPTTPGVPQFAARSRSFPFDKLRVRMTIWLRMRSFASLRMTTRNVRMTIRNRSRGFHLSHLLLPALARGREWPRLRAWRRHWARALRSCRRP